MKVDIPMEDGNVISLTAVRESYRMRHIKKLCTHLHTTIDATLSHLTCDDCGKELNPVEFLFQLADRWSSIQRMTAEYKKALAAYEVKKRTKCDHCGKMTDIRPARLGKEMRIIK